MTDCFKNDTPLLDEMEPMAEKECQTESWSTRVIPSGNEKRARPHEPVDMENDGESKPQSAKRLTIDSDGVVGVLNYWGLATIIPSSGTRNTDRTRTIPFMGLQPLSGNPLSHIWHDAESFLWVFLWVCGCSDGSGREVLVPPYKVWRKRDMLSCKKARCRFLSDWNHKDISVPEHHSPNHLFCLFLIELLHQLMKNIPTSADHNVQEQKEDMAEIKALLPKLQGVRAELNKNFGGEHWFDSSCRSAIWDYIHTTVSETFVTEKNNRM